MDCLTLPRLHAAIPVELASAQAEAAILQELQRRCERRLVVRARRRRSAQAAMEATLKALFNPRGGPSERFLELLVALDDEAYLEDNSSFSPGDLTWSLHPDVNPHWVYVGQAIEHLEQIQTGLGETVLHALFDAVRAVDGIMDPQTVRDLSEMMYWDNATDDDEAKQCLEERGYDMGSQDARPLLPSELESAAGGAMWMAPQKRLRDSALRKALAGTGDAALARLANLVTSHLPRATRACRQTRRNVQCEGSYYSFMLGIWPSVETADHAAQLMDDLHNDRMNSGESDVLFRCETQPLMGSPRAKKPKTADGLAVTATHLWVYHYIDQALGVLVDLQHSLPQEGKGSPDADHHDEQRGHAQADLGDPAV